MSAPLTLTLDAAVRALVAEEVARQLAELAGPTLRPFITAAEAAPLLGYADKPRAAAAAACTSWSETGASPATARAGACW